MIVAKRKPFDEIKGMVKEKSSILLVGCGSCVSICHTGGEKEVAILASELRISSKSEGRGTEIDEVTILRQCEPEFVDGIKEKIEKVDLILSLACGVGVQTIAERYPAKLVYPALNTTGMAELEKPGEFREKCVGCGSCVLGDFAGICPLTCCSKGLLNGPCGGTKNGKCEVSPEIECGWQLIYERLKNQGKLNFLKVIQPAKNWSISHYGGARKLVIQEVQL